MRKFTLNEHFQIHTRHWAFNLRFFYSIIAVCAASVVAGCGDADEINDSTQTVMPIESDEGLNVATQASSEPTVTGDSEWNFLLHHCVVLLEVHTTPFAQRCDFDGARQASEKWDGKSTIDIRFLGVTYTEKFKEIAIFTFYRDSTWGAYAPLIEDYTAKRLPIYFKKGADGAVHVITLSDNNCEEEEKFVKISENEVDVYYLRASETCERPLVREGVGVRQRLVEL